MVRALVALTVMAGLSLVAAGPALAQGSVPVQGPQSYTLGTFNMAGGHKKYGDRRETADALARSMTSRGADVVFLQEACRKMTKRLVHKLPGSWNGVFAAAVSRDRGSRDRPRPLTCIRNGTRDGSDFGLGVVYRSSRFKLAGTYKHPLPSAGFERRMILCLDFATPRPILACSTHLTAKNGKVQAKNRREQTEEIIKFLSPALFGSAAVFLGGDLNTTPEAHALDPLWDWRYGGGAFGPFIEVDSSGFRRDAGKETQSGLAANKLDYIFVRRVAVTRAEVGRSKHSDHAPLWATVLH